MCYKDQEKVTHVYLYSNKANIRKKQKQVSLPGGSYGVCD